MQTEHRPSTLDIVATLPDSRFIDVSRRVLRDLRELYGFQLWMVTHVEGDDWIVLCAEDHGYGVQAGDVMQWGGSVCHRMVAGLGPFIAPDVSLVPAYMAAPIRRDLAIRAYIGLPLRRADGTLFGTLCAIDPSPQPAYLTGSLPVIEMHAGLLSRVLESETRRGPVRRLVLPADEAIITDRLTGLLNRRGWTQLLDQQEARCHHDDLAATVIIVDIDELKTVNGTQGHGAGDDVIRRAAVALRAATRTGRDVCARLGGDEFGVLLTGWPHSAKDVARELTARLASSGVHATVGAAERSDTGLHEAAIAAERIMHEAKRMRHSDINANRVNRSLAAHDGARLRGRPV